MTTRLIPTQRMQVSPIARAACVVYGMLLLYSGLAPWSGWRDLGIDAWAYLTAPAPHYITTFDLVANVLAYLPFGALIVLEKSAIGGLPCGQAGTAVAAQGAAQDVSQNIRSAPLCPPKGTNIQPWLN